MSASSKKKLRNELNAAKLTERQLAEQKEAKKIKLMTFSFTAVLAVILVVALVFAVTQFVTNSGIREKNTVALTIGDQEMSNAQLNYYYVDAVYEFSQTYGSYASLFGLDLTKPLNEQVVNPETGATWADDFLTSAKSNAQSTIALVNAAKEAGHTLTAEELNSVNSTVSTMEIYASINGYTVDQYIQAFYGPGASLESFREYSENRALAQSYYSSYVSQLTYEESDLREAEAGKEAEFSAYTYDYYYLNVSKFLQGGTTAEDGTTTYSDEERAAAVAAAEAAAKEVVAAEIASTEDLNAAIAALAVNAEATTAPTATVCADYAYANVTTAAKEWITDASRKAGDVTYVANSTTSTNEDGTETTTVNGYYVVLFHEANDNTFPLVNVRHILITPEGGTYDSTTGTTNYTDEEKLAAKVKAEELLAEFLAGKAIEENFAALATEHTTDPGSKENGGLYEDVYPGEMVASFNDWCFAEGRKAGDTGIVETEYGYHIMFYVGDSETCYRDLLIENSIRSADAEAWYAALIEATVVTELNTQYLSKDLVLSAQ